MEETIIQTNHIPGIKRQKDGRYAIDLIRCINGKRVHVYSSNFLTQDDALKALPHLIESKTTYMKEKEGQELCFKQFVTRYENYRLLHVRKSTTQLARCVIKKYFSSCEDLLVNEVFTFARIHNIYQDILEDEGTPSWKNRCFGTLRLMAEAAYKWKCISSNAHQDCLAILENIPENRGAKIEKQIWNRREKAKFIAAIDQEEDRVLFILFMTLGARIGEFMGLTWDCFNEKNNTIEIKQQLIYQNTGKWVLSPNLKTRESYRICKISSSIASILKAYKASGNGEGFMFHSSIDKTQPMSKGAFRKKMNHYIEKAKVKRITPHAIRHGKATELMKVCKNMQEVKAAARFLGHSATMMIDTYGHSERSTTDAILKRLEKEEEEFFQLNESSD